MPETVELLDSIVNYHHEKWLAWEKHAVEGVDKKIVVDPDTGFLFRIFHFNDYENYCHFCFANYCQPVNGKEFVVGDYYVMFGEKENTVEKY